MMVYFVYIQICYGSGLLVRLIGPLRKQQYMMPDRIYYIYRIYPTRSPRVPKHFLSYPLPAKAGCCADCWWFRTTVLFWRLRVSVTTLISRADAVSTFCEWSIVYVCKQLKGQQFPGFHFPLYRVWVNICSWGRHSKMDLLIPWSSCLHQFRATDPGVKPEVRHRYEYEHLWVASVNVATAASTNTQFTEGKHKILAHGP